VLLGISDGAVLQHPLHHPAPVGMGGETHHTTLDVLHTQSTGVNDGSIGVAGQTHHTTLDVLHTQSTWGEWWVGIQRSSMYITLALFVISAHRYSLVLCSD